MRKIIVSAMVSLDSAVENPQRWSFDYANDEFMKYASDQLNAADALIMGRVTYEGFAQAWPARAGADAFADRMNSLPKYVASKTLKKAEWSNSTLISGGLVEATGKIKNSTSGHIVIYGSASLVGQLMPRGLIDEYALMVFPIILGRGTKLFPSDISRKLALIESQQFGDGIMLLRYGNA